MAESWLPRGIETFTDTIILVFWWQFLVFVVRIIMKEVNRYVCGLGCLGESGLWGLGAIGLFSPIPPVLS